jgi:hypothetical protein
MKKNCKKIIMIDKLKELDKSFKPISFSSKLIQDWWCGVGVCIS